MFLKIVLNGFYISNGMFKQAMKVCGFKVKNESETNWTFNISHVSEMMQAHVWLIPRQSGFWNHSCCQRWQGFFVFKDGEYSIVCVTFVHPYVHTLKHYSNLLTRNDVAESVRACLLFNMLTQLPLAIHLSRLIRSLNGLSNSNFKRSF